MYDKVEWKEITLTGCDSMDRYYVHIQELYQSLDIIEQLIDNIPEGEYYIKQKPIIKVPEGQWYFSVEGASGEFGVYLDSKGDKSPYRMKIVRWVSHSQEPWIQCSVVRRSPTSSLQVQQSIS